MSEKKRTRPIKKALKILGAAFAVLLIIVGAFFIWLRTSSGSGFVFGQLSKILAGAGYTLTADDFQGPLPSRIFIRNLTLADADGPLVKVETAELQLAVTSLLSRTVHVPLLKIDKPQIIRLPESEAKAEEEESGPFSLPVKIRLDRLEINDGKLAEDGLASVGILNNALYFKAEGLGRIIGPGSELALSAEVQEDLGHELLALKLALSENDLIDQLNLDLKIDDRPEGFLSALFNDPTWPGLTVKLNGQGPLNNWLGQLDAGYGTLGQTTAELQFKGQTGNLWLDLIGSRNFAAELKADLQGGRTFPAPAAELLGALVQLTATARLSGPDLGLNLIIDGDSGLSFTSELTGKLAAEAKDLSLQGVLNGLRQIDKEQTESLYLTADLHLDDQTQTLKDLRLNGNGLNLAGQLNRSPDTGALKGDLSFHSNADSPLVRALLDTAGLADQAFGGDIDLLALIDWRGSGESSQGDLKLNGRNLLWPNAALEKLIGPSFDLAAELNGGGPAPVKLKLVEARGALVQARAEASIEPAELMNQSRFSAEATAELIDLTELNPELGGALSLDLKASGTPENIRALLNIDSDSLVTAQGEFKDLSLKLNLASLAATASSADQSQNLGLDGNLDLRAGDSPGGPLDLNLVWALKQLNDNIDLTVSDLNGDLAGLKLSGGLRAVLAEDRKLDGSLNIDVAAWDKLAALTGQKLSGEPAKMVLTLTSAEDGQAAEAVLDLPGLRLNNGRETILSFKKTALNFSGRKLFTQPSLDLNLALGAGLAGPFSWQAGQVTAKGLDGRGDLSADLSQARLNGKGGGRADGLKLEAGYDLNGEPDFNISRLDFQLAGSGFSLMDSVTVSLGEHLSVSPFALNFKPGGQLAAELDLNPGALTVKARGEKIPFKAFQVFSPEGAPDGEIQSVNIDINQRPDGLAGIFDLQTMVAAKELRNIKPVISLTGELTAGAAPNLSVEGKIDGGSGWRADGDFKARLPLTPGIGGGFPQPNNNGPLAAELKFVGPAGPLWVLANQPDRSFNALVQLEANIGGTLAKPVTRGTLYVAEGRYEDSVLGLLVTNIKVEAHSTPELPLKALISAEDGKRGGAALEAQLTDLNAPKLNVKGRLNHFSPTHRDDLVLYISGDFGAEGPVERLSVSSDLTLDQGELDLQIISAGGSVPTLRISNQGDALVPTSRGLRSDLKINVPGRFFIRGPGLESEWRGVMTVGGSTSNPSLVGNLTPIRGYYTFAAKEFQFTGGEITFSGGTNPVLSLELTNQTPGLTAILRFGGTATNPTLAMESQPPLPEEEVLAHVLFGKSASDISRFEALQLASAINNLRNFGNSGFDALSTVRSSLGLDVLRLGGSNENRQRQVTGMAGSIGQDLGGGAASANNEQGDDISVEAGKYLSDNIYVGVEHSGVGGAAVRLEVELAPNISLEGRSSTESSRIGVGWKKDY